MTYQPLQDFLKSFAPMLDTRGMAAGAKVDEGSLIKYMEQDKSSFIAGILADGKPELTPQEETRVLEVMLIFATKVTEALKDCVK
jgi:hypothetical protein